MDDKAFFRPSYKEISEMMAGVATLPQPLIIFLKT